MHLANAELPRSISLAYSYMWYACMCVLVCVVGGEERRLRVEVDLHYTPLQDSANGCKSEEV